MEIIINCEVKAYNCRPQDKNTMNAFCLNETLLISFCDGNDNVLQQSEISMEDAKVLAKINLSH